jgi:hypothetical protein
MEIGKRGRLSTYEQEYYTRKAISLLITTILVLAIMCFMVVANYTSLLERNLFQHIADKYGYTLSYSSAYELLSSDNSEEGNYIQLSDEENGIYILFRYDEDSKELVEIIDEVTNTSSIYAVKTTVSKDKTIQTEESIINNIDKEFNPLNPNDVKDGRDNIGGGYSIVKLDTVMSQHRVDFTSNLLSNLKNYTSSKKYNLASSEDILSVTKWIDSSKSINYHLSILKSIVETRSDDNGTDYQIVYSGSSGNGKIVTAGDIDDTESTEVETETKEIETIDKSLEGFISNREEILKKYSSAGFSTYTSIILNQAEKADSIFDIKLFSRTSDTPDGVIIGTCLNNDEAIEKMTTTMNYLIIVSYLESTLIL